MNLSLIIKYRMLFTQWTIKLHCIFQELYSFTHRAPVWVLSMTFWNTFCVSYQDCKFIILWKILTIKVSRCSFHMHVTVKGKPWVMSLTSLFLLISSCIALFLCFGFSPLLSSLEILHSTFHLFFSLLVFSLLRSGLIFDKNSWCWVKISLLKLLFLAPSLN